MSYLKRLVVAANALVALASCGPTKSGLFPPPVFRAQSASDWPDVGAVITEDVATIEYRKLEGEQGERVIAVVDHRRRLQILDETGLARARVSLPVDGFSSIAWVRGRSANPDGSGETLDPFDARLVPLDSAHPPTDEVRNLVFTIPGARVGGLVEYRYQRVYRDPDFVPVWVFGDEVPIVRAELGIVVGDRIKVDYRYGRGEKIVENLPMRRRTEDGRPRLLFVEQNLPAYYREPNMPHLGRVAPWVALVMTSARLGDQRRRLETWVDVAKRLSALLLEVADEPLDVSGSPEARYEKVRNTLQPLGLRGIGVRQPVPANELQRGEPACSRDASAVLLGALQGSGAKAYPAFLTGPSGPVALEGFPGLYPFVAGAVAVDVSDKIASDPTCREDPVKRGLLCTVPPDSYAFLDASCSLCRYGELPTDLTGGRALVIADEGPRWVEIPIDPPERNRVMTQVRGILQVDGKIKGGASAELAGAPHRKLRRLLDEAGDAKQRVDIISRELIGQQSELTLERVKLDTAKNPAQPLRLRGRMVSEVQKLSYDQFAVRPIDIAGAAIAHRVRASRRYPAILDAPHWVETAVSIEVPVGFDAQLPPMLKIVEPFAEYAAGYSFLDRTLSFSRRLVIKKHVIGVEQWRDFKDFADRIAEFEATGVQVGVRR